MTFHYDILFPFVVVTVLILFIIDILAIIVAKPTILTNSPSAENSMEIVDQSAGRALAIFALVLVVVQFSLDGDSLAYYETLSLTTLVLAAGFLIISFMLELVTDLRTIFFRIQLNALRYSGLLLFSGLFLILYSKNHS